MIGVSVGDVPAAATPTEDGLWRLPLGPSGYPRCVDVLMTGRIPGSRRDGRWRLEAPRLEGLTAARISPDGSMIALITARSLRVRDMATGEIREVHQYQDGFIAQPTWSTDSAWISFFSQGGLWRVRVSDGACLRNVRGDFGV